MYLGSGLELVLVRNGWYIGGISMDVTLHNPTPSSLAILTLVGYY
jgi:hypothetical protein